MRVVITTMFSDSHKELADITVPNMEAYAKFHGYDTHIIKIENDKWEYKKHEAFIELLKEYDLVWYKDIDSIITHIPTPITDFVDNQHSVFITEDATELNGGSLIIFGDKKGQYYNYLILSYRGALENEQNAYVLTYEDCLETVKVLKHPSINSYDYSQYPELPHIRKRQHGHWHEGDFLLHTPALPMDKRIEILKNAKIIYE